MKRIFKGIVTLILFSFLVGCTGQGNLNQSGTSGGDASGQDSGFKIKAVVNNISDDSLDVTVTEDDENAFGVYLVITSEMTEYIGKDGAKINRSDIHENDVIEVLYNGMVTRSLPPHINAEKIIIVGKK